MKKGDSKGVLHAEDAEDPIFFGEYEHSVDSQRRIAIPSSWRSKGSPSRFVLLRGHDSIHLIPLRSFRRDVYEKMRKVTFADKEASRALAKLASQAQECECDGQGRISVPQRLMETAGIGDQAVLVGALNSAQIWSAKRWKEVRDAESNDLDVIRRISEGGQI